MKVKLLVSTEVNTVIDVDVPVNREDSIEGIHEQVSTYVNEHCEEFIEKVKDNLFRNFNSDWRENVYLNVEDIG